MNLQNIKAIDLSPQQMTFGFDDNTLELKEVVLSCIVELIADHGRLTLDTLVSHTQKHHGTSEFDTLQSVFWLANELKIHLRFDNKNITPFKAKKIVVKSPDTCVEIVTIKKVEDSIFKKIVPFYNTLFKNKQKDFNNDQYSFAQALLSDLQTIEQKLAACRLCSQKSHFPYEKKIDDHLKFLKMILAQKDSCSLITICSSHMETIALVVEDEKTISHFYKQHGKFWETAIKSMSQFQKNMDQIKKNPEILQDFQALVKILDSSHPHEMAARAEYLFKRIKACNDKIVQEKTKVLKKQALSQTDSMISNLSLLLDKSRADHDQRNFVLLAMRRVKGKLNHAGTMIEIEKLLGNAKDLHDDFIEELDQKN